MNKANECTCPSGDGSLVHPCPAHPAVEQAGGDELAAFELFVRKHCGMPAHIAVNWDAKFTNDAWEGWQARAALAQPSPVRSSLLINGYQLRAALDFIAPDGTAEQLKSEACIEWRQQDADFLEAGLYAFCAEYPEEGGVLLDEEPTTAQPSPLQSEQAEAERPEVVARVVHSNPVVLGQCGPLNANDELMTVAQHAASVARWAEMFNRVEQERDAALARVAKMERQEPVALANRGLHAFWVKWTEAAAGLYGPGIKLYAAPVAQAQQLHDLDKQCRDDVARALGLRPNQERGFAWSYLLASIKSCVKASEDSAQAQHSVPGHVVVSEGLVQGMAKFAREIICGALDGGSFDGADIQESAERHGLIAKQVMKEPCRGPEEYCACAWSTSFPAECYRVTPKLRALLNEDKENGDHAA